MEEQTRVKICGLMRVEDIEAVNEEKPDFVGFIFAGKSRRRITKEHAMTLRNLLDASIKAVGVFVNELPSIVAGYLEEGIIDLAQLHGEEDDIYIHNLRLQTGQPLIQAFSIRGPQDIERAERSSADYVLLDQGEGGSGTPFDWSLAEQMDRPYFLAGGLGPENVEEAVRRLHPFAVDLNSRLETNGAKDREKIKECIRRIRHV